MSDFDIYLDADNELAFSLDIEGAESASVRSQFIIEGPRGIKLAFDGQAANSDVVVEVPSLKGMLSEGIYQTRLEVIIDDRIFTPLELQAKIKPSIKVEAAVRTARKTSKPVVTARVLSSPTNTGTSTLAEDTHTTPQSSPVKPKVVPPRSRHPRSGSPNLDSLLSVLESLE